jgi:DNA-directed RNA polymerase subunit omega
MFRAPMARVTVEDCLEREENRFALVIMAAKRTRNLMKGEPPLIICKNKPLVAALREIASGKVSFDRRTSDVVEEWVAIQRQKYLDSQ